MGTRVHPLVKRKRIGVLVALHRAQSAVDKIESDGPVLSRANIYARPAIFTRFLCPARYALRLSLASQIFMNIDVPKTRGIAFLTQKNLPLRHTDQAAGPESGSERSLRRSDARSSLWSRFAEWVYAALPPRDMSLEWTCCGTPMLDPAEAYLGRVESFELSISSCAHCGMLWLGIRSLVTTVTRTDPLPPDRCRSFSRRGTWNRAARVERRQRRNRVCRNGQSGTASS